MPLVYHVGNLYSIGDKNEGKINWKWQYTSVQLGSSVDRLYYSTVYRTKKPIKPQWLSLCTLAEITVSPKDNNIKDHKCLKATDEYFCSSTLYKK